ncbi:hypothetical protein K523DRAFT_25180 [Schizophyllum commune Tattone D]|nr:hypothetical protein K523DRAFT_25180 [Schizophyllum commune Tattone D]
MNTVGTPPSPHHVACRRQDRDCMKSGSITLNCAPPRTSNLAPHPALNPALALPRLAQARTTSVSPRRVIHPSPSLLRSARVYRRSTGCFIFLLFPSSHSVLYIASIIPHTHRRHALTPSRESSRSP